MSFHTSLEFAKQKKNDEFYTLLKDVEAELSYYREHFFHKRVYLNCDNPVQSSFWEYFHKYFSELGLRSLMATHYSRTGPSFLITYDGGEDEITLPKQFQILRGDGDFSSKECREILDSCDIVVTNPPFSLFSSYIKLLADHNKQFLVIGNLNAVTYKACFPLFCTDQMWLGHTHPKQFLRPDGAYQTFGNIVWFTNLDAGKQKEPLMLEKCYTPESYPNYDNYNAIHVGRVADIPKDYAGAMGVPVTFLNKHNSEQFQILGATESEGKGFSHGLLLPGSSVMQPVVCGKRVYKRIFIKRR